MVTVGNLSSYIYMPGHIAPIEGEHGNTDGTNPVRPDLEYRHVQAIVLFQELYRLKRATLARLNTDLDIIYSTLVSIVNNINTNYLSQVISQENYTRFMTSADSILGVLRTIPRPLTLSQLHHNQRARYVVAYLHYQVTELAKLCGTCTCYDLFRIIVGHQWDLSIRPQHTKLLRLYNTMFVPISAKVGPALSETHVPSEIKVTRYSAFTLSLLLKVHGAEISVPFYDKTLSIKGYFRDDPLNIGRVGGTLEQKYKELTEVSQERFGQSEFLQSYLKQITLRDFLCQDVSGLIQMIQNDKTEQAALKQKPVGHVVEEFLKAALKKQYTTLTLLLLNENTHGHACGLIGTLVTQQPDRLTLLYRILHWSVQLIFDKVTKSIDKSNPYNGLGVDESELPYETRIEALKCSETIKRKAREKLKEIKLSKDGNEKASKYLDGLLLVPFGTYRREPILRYLGEYKDRLRTFHTSLNERLECVNTENAEHNDELHSAHYIIAHTNYETETGIEKLLRKLCPGRLSPSSSLTVLPSHPALPALPAIEDGSNNWWLRQECRALCQDWDNFKLQRQSYLTTVKETMTRSIYGQDDAKRCIESLIAQWINGEMTGTVIGFHGYPGTGKTTLAKQGIAQCLLDVNGESRPFYFIPLGGSTGGNTLEGHSYTYVGSHWGKLVDCLQEARVMNPILYFDELDKVSETEKGSEIIRILTHLTDPEQNERITDRYFDLGFDFSKALIIFSYNSPDKIDKILMERIYKVPFRQYNCKEKVVIAQDYVLPRILKSVGYTKDMLVFSDDILRVIIDNYTIEAGVRDLKDRLTEIVREINLRRIYNEGSYEIPYTITQDTVDDILKLRNRIKITTVPKVPQIGWVNGLYATSLGTGGLTVIQVFNTPSDQKYALELTGSLGNVMKESVRCAKTISFRIFDAEDKKIMAKEWCEDALHVHFPECGTSKDGPSAGAAITLAIISYFSRLPVRQYIAMTGEIDLYGSVTIIGGLQCKIEGAQRAGVKLVLIPRDNEGEYKDFGKDYSVKVLPVDNISQIVRCCLIGAEHKNFQYAHDVTNAATLDILNAIAEIEAAEN